MINLATNRSRPPQQPATHDINMTRTTPGDQCISARLVTTILPTCSAPDSFMQGWSQTVLLGCCHCCCCLAKPTKVHTPHLPLRNLPVTASLHTTPNITSWSSMHKSCFLAQKQWLQNLLRQVTPFLFPTCFFPPATPYFFFPDTSVPLSATLVTCRCREFAATAADDQSLMIHDSSQNSLLYLLHIILFFNPQPAQHLCCC